jgi:hypothetical protein
MMNIARFLLSLSTGLTLACAAVAGPAISNSEAISGLQAALARGAEAAVNTLGQQNGFLGNSSVRIDLPPSLQKAEGIARQLGFDRQADDLVNALNHAAESAVTQAKPILMSALKKMTIQDAAGILNGAPDAATQYFRRNTSAAISAKFLPVVRAATAKVQLAGKYNEFAGKAAALGLMDGKDADLDAYVTQRALDGLFLMIAQEEKQIRADPVGTGSKLLQKVFGSLL